MVIKEGAEVEASGKSANVSAEPFLNTLAALHYGLENIANGS
jgi:hypothetical protein